MKGFNSKWIRFEEHTVLIFKWQFVKSPSSTKIQKKLSENIVYYRIYSHISRIQNYKMQYSNQRVGLYVHKKWTQEQTLMPIF